MYESGSVWVFSAFLISLRSQAKSSKFSFLYVDIQFDVREWKFSRKKSSLKCWLRFSPISITGTKIIFCYNFVVPLRYDTFYLVRPQSFLTWKQLAIIIIIIVITIAVICFIFFSEFLVPKVVHQWVSTHILFETNMHYLKHSNLSSNWCNKN